MAQTQVKTPGCVQAENVLTDIVAAGNTTLLDIDVSDIDQLAVELVTSADQAADVFTVQAKVHPNSSYVSILTAITATPAGLVVFSTGTLASQAAGSSHVCVLNVQGFFSLRFLGSAAVDGEDLTIRARGTGPKNSR